MDGNFMPKETCDTTIDGKPVKVILVDKGA
jgi:hypothetical protein